MNKPDALPAEAYEVNEDETVLCSYPPHMREDREALWRVDFLAGGQTFVAVCGEECAEVAAEELDGREILPSENADGADKNE